ncbi:MAG TPA: CARDB domain-containing protein, partial [Candidatus Paceibacterota bacterium]|nr:CARDB domain-containing protein [Candidatus Paceibacterota bacterium]
ISVIATQGGWVQQGNLITASLGTLARGASASLTTIVTPASLGTITNIAGVKSTATDPNPADNVATLAVTVSLPEQSVLFVNVNGSYDGDGNSIYQTLLWAGAQATWVHLDANGKVAALLQTNHYDQIWVYDLSTGADNYPADWQAIADWFNARASRTLICDGRIISSYWSGRYNSEGKRLTKNYYENFKTFGGGLLLGTDHSAYQPGINNINDAINVQRFSGNFNLSSIPVDTNSPLMAIPNNLGGALSDDSSPGQAPFGLQPGGLILYSVAWHSGNTNTPGISTTIRGGVGFRTLIAAPANNSTFNEDSAVTFQAQPLNGVAPFTFQWTSDRDGLFATGMVAQVSNLSTGLHRITLVGTESGGGADSDSIQVTIQPVTAAITMNLRSGDDSGASTNDFITSVATPVFEVTINKRGQIEFDYTGDGTADEVRANLTPGVHEFTPPVLADGSHNFTARFVPLRGNPVEASATVTIDTHGPRIAAMEPAAGSALSHGLDHVDLTFDEAIDSASFTAADVALSGPGGSFAATGVSVLSSNQFRVSFPAQAAIGAYTLTFGPGIADVAGNLMNQNSNATNGEAADAFTTALTIALPDLAIVALTAPATAQPEVPFELAWTVTNRGNAVTTGPWTETLFVSNSVSGVQTLAGFTGSSALAPGASATRTQSITLPANGPAGELHFSVVADSGNVVAEIDEANNSLAAPNTTTVPLKLKLELSATEVAENAVSPVQATVTRNGDRSAALTVTLGNSGPAHLNSPASVEISAGQASATFNIQPLHDGLVTGSQHVKVTASATGFTGGNQTLTVLDVDQPNFMLVISTNTMLEGRTVGAVISRGLVTTNPLTVVFGSSDPNRLVVPDSVVIPANADSASFAILAKDNTLIEPPQNYTISASAPGFTTTGTSVTVNDDDTPQVTVTLADHIVSESAGPQATTATITRDPVATRSVLVELFSSNTNTAQVPAQVIIPANKPSVTFNVSAVNDPNLTGSKSVSIGGYVIATVSSARVSNITPDTLTVTDDSSPSLQIAFAQKIVKEGADPATTVTVTRNTPATNDLVVTLSSSDTNKLVVPATVTITNGQSSVEFSVATISDNLNTGNATVTVTASAAGFASAAGNLTVTDVDLPDLAIAGITLPAAADTESSTTVSYRIVNQGLAAVGTNFLTRVFLSADPLGNTSTLIGQYRFPGPLPVGGQFEMSSPVQLPQKAGDYWIVVQTDVEGNVTEGLKDNNTGISKTAIRANAAYAAWVQVSPPKLWLAGTPVSMSGRATNHLGAGVASKLVNIHVVLRGTDRVISALTDANGYFSTTFQPLANEAGSYQVFATHPGVPTGTAQDAFTLLGMRVNPVVTSASFDEQSGTSGSIAIENLSDTPLTGLSATVMSKPDGLNVGINLSGTTINGSGTVSLGYTLNAATTTGSGVVHVHLRTTEGVEGEAYFTVQVIALRPKLVADPAQLIAGMVGGKQVTLQFNITNAGAIATGPITVSLPSVAWMQLASTNPMPSLAPGETNQVTLVLTPPVGLPLGPYSGNLALNCTGDSLSVPFTFRCLSEASGELVVSAVDEYTFYAAGSPKLTNATVVVRDAFNHAVVTNGVTGADGSFHAGALLEGYYEISVSAPKHNGYSGSRFVTAGVTNEVEAFLNLQTVQYVWTVEPTEIEDRTKITIETVFETYVPAPVVTIEPALIDLAEIKGNEAQVNLKISNHGLIAAKDFKLNMPTHDLWEFTPLISDVGNIPAQSTLTVPLTIRRIVPGSPKAMAKASAKDSGSDCNTAGDGCFHFDCGRYSFTVCLPVNFINTDDDCSRPSVPGLPFVFNPGGFGTPTGGPSGGSSGPAGTGRIDIPQTFSVKSCEDCVNSLAKAMFDCFIGFTPESWVRDGFKCAYSSANVIASPNDSLGWAGAFLDCASAFGHAAPGVGQVLGVLSCLNGLISACLNEPGSGPDVGAKLALLRDSHVLAAKIPDQFRDRVPEGLLRKFPAMATLTERADRVATYPKLLDTILGDDA